MTISDRIFERLNDLSMSQKEFSQKTGILQSTISEWKKNHTNPTSEKIMTICSVLEVTPEWLLTGTNLKKKHQSDARGFFVGRDTEIGALVEYYNQLDVKGRERVLGYIKAIWETNQE